MMFKVQEERSVASFLPAKVESSTTKVSFVRRSSSVYHKHPEWKQPKFVFKARPVPKFNFKWEDRTVKNKDLHSAQSRPFSFYESYKDIEKRRNERLQKIFEEEQKKRQYKARPIPSWLYRYTLSSPEIQTLKNHVKRSKKLTSLPTRDQAESKTNNLNEKMVNEKDAANEENLEKNKEERKDMHIEDKEDRKAMHIKDKEDRKAMHSKIKEDRQGMHSKIKEDRKAMHSKIKEDRKAMHSKIKEDRKAMHSKYKRDRKAIHKEDRKALLVRSKAAQNIGIAVKSNAKMSMAIPKQSLDACPRLPVSNNASFREKGNDSVKKPTKKLLDASKEKVAHKIPNFELKKKPKESMHHTEKIDEQKQFKKESEKSKVVKPFTPEIKVENCVKARQSVSKQNIAKLSVPKQKVSKDIEVEMLVTEKENRFADADVRTIASDEKLYKPSQTPAQKSSSENSRSLTINANNKVEIKVDSKRIDYNELLAKFCNMRATLAQKPDVVSVGRRGAFKEPAVTGGQFKEHTVTVDQSKEPAATKGQFQESAVTVGQSKEPTVIVGQSKECAVIVGQFTEYAVNGVQFKEHAVTGGQFKEPAVQEASLRSVQS